MTRWGGCLSLQVAADHAESGRAKALSLVYSGEARAAFRDPKSLDDEIERFLSHVPKVGPNECAIWTGSYLRVKRGRLKRAPQARFQQSNRKYVYARRYAFELVHGPLKRGEVVYLSCFQSACCNVRHMWVGTNADRGAYLRDSGILPAKHARAIGNGPAQRKAKVIEERLLADLVALRAVHLKRYRAFLRTFRQQIREACEARASPAIA